MLTALTVIAAQHVLVASTAPPSLLQLLHAHPQLSNFSAIVAAAGVANKFDDPTSLLTLFAPTDAAFINITGAQLSQLKTTDDSLHHACFGDILTTALRRYRGQERPFSSMPKMGLKGAI